MKQVNKRAFTIVELLLAVGLLVAMMAVSVVVFKVAIDAQQKAIAMGDYMRTITSIKTQINNDFSSIDENAPFAVWFDRNGNDRMFFFGTGFFEQLSGGNLDTTSDIFTYGSFLYLIDAPYELLREFNGWDRYQDVIIPDVASNERDVLEAKLNASITYNESMPSTYQYLLSDKIKSFKIQMLYRTEFGKVRWYPEEDSYPLLAGDSDYDLMGDSFGVFFNIPAANSGNFYPPEDLSVRLILADGTLDNAVNFDMGYKPLAFKFTITLTDPDQKLEDKKFTYVVDLSL
ncbi:MAG: hypothetical protein ACIAQZ_05875 [Sedimentisphaeraceae bacterium JB056]